MKPILFAASLVLFVGCTPGRPRMPAFTTPVGADCGRMCLKGYVWCMDAACPAKATSNCEPKCRQRLEECYETCLETENHPIELPVDPPR